MKTIEKFLIEKGFTVNLLTQDLYGQRKTDNIDYYVTIHKKSGMYQTEISEATNDIVRTRKLETSSAKECFKKLKICISSENFI